MNRTKRLRVCSIAALSCLLAFAGASREAAAANRVFRLWLVNSTEQPVTFSVHPGKCYEGTHGKLGPIPPGGRKWMTIARVQGHGCDGKDGTFALVPDTHGGEPQGLQFDNRGKLWMNSIPTSYRPDLSPKHPDESYVYTMRPLDPRVRHAVIYQVFNKVSRRCLVKTKRNVHTGRPGGIPSELKVAPAAKHDDSFRWVFRKATGESDYWNILNLRTGLALTLIGDHGLNDMVLQSGSSTIRSQQWKLDWGDGAAGQGICRLQNRGNQEWLVQAGFGRSAAQTGVLTQPLTADQAGFEWVINAMGQADLGFVTLDKIRCVRPSSGQDGNTKILFAGIDKVLEIAAATATGGGSVGITTIAKEGAKHAVKQGLRAGIRRGQAMLTKKLMKSMVKKAAVKAAVKRAALEGGNAAMAQNADSFSELLFNAAGGGSTDDQVFIKVNEYPVWPHGGGYRSMNAGDSHAVNSVFMFKRNNICRVRVMERDTYSKNDVLLDFPGITDDVIQLEEYEEIFVVNKSEGCVYAIGLQIEPFAKWTPQSGGEPLGIVDTTVFSLENNAHIPDGTLDKAITSTLWTYTYFGIERPFAFGVNGDIRCNLFSTPPWRWRTINGAVQMYTGDGSIMVIRFDRDLESFIHTWGDGKTKGFGRAHVASNDFKRARAQITAKRTAGYKKMMTQFTHNRLSGTIWDYQSGQERAKVTFAQDGQVHGYARWKGYRWRATDYKVIEVYWPSATSLQFVLQLSGSQLEHFSHSRGDGTNASGRFIQEVRIATRLERVLTKTTWVMRIANADFELTFGPNGDVQDSKEFGHMRWRVTSPTDVTLYTADGRESVLNFNRDLNSFVHVDANGAEITGKPKGAKTPLELALDNSTWVLTNSAGKTLELMFGRGGDIRNSGALVEFRWRVVHARQVELVVGGAERLMLDFDPQLASFTCVLQGDRVTGRPKAGTGTPGSGTQALDAALADTTWLYIHNGVPYEFTLGQGGSFRSVIMQLSPTWQGVQWRVVGQDTVELFRGNSKIVLRFNGLLSTFTATDWDGSTPVTGRSKPGTGVRTGAGPASGVQPAAQTGRQQLELALSNSTWLYTHYTGTYEFTLGPGGAFSSGMQLIDPTNWKGVRWRVVGPQTAELYKAGGMKIVLKFDKTLTAFTARNWDQTEVKGRKK